MKFKRTKPLPIFCLKCRYSWNTKTTLLFVTCPNCGSRVRVVEDGKTGATT